MWERQSGLFGVISSSNTTSFTPRYSFNGIPIGASSGKIIIPLESLPSPSSSSEQSIPLDSTPLIFPFFMTKSSAILAPICASATLSPALWLGAPHTICKTSFPLSTLQIVRWSESGCISFSTIFAVTTFSRFSPFTSIFSTSCPIIVKAFSSSLISIPSKSIYCFSQFNEISILFFSLFFKFFYLFFTLKLPLDSQKF